MEIMTKFQSFKQTTKMLGSYVIASCNGDQTRDGVAPAVMIRLFHLQPPFSQSKPLPGRGPMGATLGSGTWVPSPI